VVGGVLGRDQDQGEEHGPNHPVKPVPRLAQLRLTRGSSMLPFSAGSKGTEWKGPLSSSGVERLQDKKAGPPAEACLTCSTKAAER
jgi:hypothetical protein